MLKGKVMASGKFEFAKGPGRKIVVQRTVYRGVDGIDIRNFWFDESANEWKPSQKGAKVPIEEIPDFLEAVGTLSKIVSQKEAKQKKKKRS